MSIKRPSYKAHILEQAVQLAKEKGLRKFSREELAKLANVGASTISFHFENMDELRREIVRHAVRNEIIPILADARSERATYGVLRLSPELKEKVAAHIAR